MNNTTVPQQ